MSSGERDPWYAYNDEPSRCGLTECRGRQECATCRAMRLQGAPSADEARAISGSHVATVPDTERIAFDAWAAAHGFGIDDMLDPLDRAVKALLWTAWRDRAALARASIQRRLEAPNIQQTGRI